MGKFGLEDSVEKTDGVHVQNNGEKARSWLGEAAGEAKKYFQNSLRMRKSRGGGTDVHVAGTKAEACRNGHV